MASIRPPGVRRGFARPLAVGPARTLWTEVSFARESFYVFPTAVPLLLALLWCPSLLWL